MTQTVMHLDDTDSLERFDAALDALEGHLKRVFADDGAEADRAVLAALQEQVRVLTEERDRLLTDLEAERARVQRLKEANEEVSGRLEGVMGALKDMAPALQD